MELVEVTVADLRENDVLIKRLIEKMNMKTINEWEYSCLQQTLTWNLVIEEILTRLKIRWDCVSYLNSYPICEASVTGDKLLFISDTHIGHESENIGYWCEAYNWALKNGITTVIHLGDLVEGASRNYVYLDKLEYDERYDILLKETQRAMSLLPNGIKTKLLFGNHDHSTVAKCPVLVSEFFRYPEKLDILGMGKVDLNWGNMYIGLRHKIGQINYVPELRQNIIKLQGHSHRCFVRPEANTILVPSLSSDDKRSDINETLAEYGFTFYPIPYIPLFIVAEKVDVNRILFRDFTKFENNPVTSDGEIEFNTQTGLIRTIKKSRCR